MESTKEREDGGISELIQARQEALNMLLVARLEGQSNRVVADAVRRAQRAADELLKARLQQAENRTENRRAS
jgi:vacuolar-type H+-ATPase subunit H